jgi:hypothetical protein
VDLNHRPSEEVLSYTVQIINPTRTTHALGLFRLPRSGLVQPPLCRINCRVAEGGTMVFHEMTITSAFVPFDPPWLPNSRFVCECLLAGLMRVLTSHPIPLLDPAHPSPQSTYRPVRFSAEKRHGAATWPRCKRQAVPQLKCETHYLCGRNSAKYPSPRSPTPSARCLISVDL